MARSPRLVVPGHALHIVQFGLNRRDVFYHDRDYQRYRKLLHDASATHEVSVHAYVLMPNHVHLLATPGNARGVARMMQSAVRQYARYLHDVYRYSGPLWASRFKSCLIGEADYFLTCSEFIETNPLRGGLVKMLSQYRWSSFHGNARGISDPLLTTHRFYLSLAATQNGRFAAYSRRFESQQPKSMLSLLRQATRRGDVFGSDDFRHQLKTSLDRDLRRLRHGGDRRSDRFLSVKSNTDRLR